MRPLTDLKFTFPKKLSTYLSNKISHKFGISGTQNPCWLMDYNGIAGNECLDTHDVFGEHYVGRRSITESGEECSSHCRGKPGIGLVCPVYNSTMGQNTDGPCMVPFCSKFNED